MARQKKSKTQAQLIAQYNRITGRQNSHGGLSDRGWNDFQYVMNDGYLADNAHKADRYRQADKAFKKLMTKNGINIDIKNKRSYNSLDEYRKSSAKRAIDKANKAIQNSMAAYGYEFKNGDAVKIEEKNKGIERRAIGMKNKRTAGNGAKGNSRG